uniref:Uncharacterized protein n=1 Tax=Trieres chinensis TaxID=1514140 RepID=A0A7S2EDG3_TRICV|mmetsp:Transcript_18172/g.36876  ORF Transcript_18172/g.36876 Transcript_18172/m.36876 type:complete len:109 (+) Transcript_18172:87-413(+)|eukprot:CAMPEP_0183295468 /NCGR_PEP_ID=MMETSP0160_2-20130417/3417_1 /TAXON_ID=2839 ORGANISM="Odontella Sinensis, Strain Grunow 1884" /NCGR_SAMPLE_ID=MMETSP0160_2 /ASSEMBLY_ACC=CAM_ASM_000250 /LENGTH=108 /DNA_ID=CAMNT_0025456957 /DNA_START=78 /DNA_END=404 /DNA_ORIENTATION=-
MIVLPLYLWTKGLPAPSPSTISGMVVAAADVPPESMHPVLHPAPVLVGVVPGVVEAVSGLVERMGDDVEGTGEDVTAVLDLVPHYYRFGFARVWVSLGRGRVGLGLEL